MVQIRVEKNRIEREKKEKNPQSQTLAKMRHLGTYLGLPMPDPTSSEYGFVAARTARDRPSQIDGCNTPNNNNRFRGITTLEDNNKTKQ
jgi:hypothetical protein